MQHPTLIGLKVAAIAVVLLLLNGCTSLFSNQARCPFTDKGGCQSVSDVNKMVDEGRFTDNGHFVQQAQQAQASAPVALPTSDDAAVSPSGWNSPTPYAGEPLRTQEVDARMWIAPWEDSTNAFHGPSYVNFVVQTPSWSTLPAKAIVRNNTDDGDA